MITKFWYLQVPTYESKKTFIKRVISSISIYLPITKILKRETRRSVHRAYARILLPVIMHLYYMTPKSSKLHLFNKYVPEKWSNNSSLPVVYVQNIRLLSGFYNIIQWSPRKIGKPESIKHKTHHETNRNCRWQQKLSEPITKKVKK